MSLGGGTLIGAGRNVQENARVALTLLILAVLAMTVLAGCGGGGGSRQTSGTAAPAEQEPESTGPAESAREDTQEDKLGHPYLGSADAPVVLTEYSDYQ